MNDSLNFIFLFNHLPGIGGIINGGGRPGGGLIRWGGIIFGGKLFFAVGGKIDTELVLKLVVAFGVDLSFFLFSCSLTSPSGMPSIP